MDDAILAALFGALFNIMDKLGDLILTTGVLDPAGHYAQPVGKTGAGVCPVQHPTDLCLRDQRSADGGCPRPDARGQRYSRLRSTAIGSVIVMMGIGLLA